MWAIKALNGRSAMNQGLGGVLDPQPQALAVTAPVSFNGAAASFRLAPVTKRLPIGSAAPNASHLGSPGSSFGAAPVRKWRPPFDNGGWIEAE